MSGPRTRDLTLPSLSRRQTLTQLMRVIFIHILNNKISKIGNIQGPTGKHSETQHGLDARESCGKLPWIGLNPPRRGHVRMNPGLNWSRSRRSHKSALTKSFLQFFETPGVSSCQYILATTRRAADDMTQTTALQVISLFVLPVVTLSW
jgi:hypothetical protein